MTPNARILSKTQSLCPVCKKPTEAYYVEVNGGVRFLNECPEHGGVSSAAAGSSEEFSEWMRAPTINIAPKQALTGGADGECPLHCGVCDRHLQTACCVLLDVTDRCDQSCPWCFAQAGSQTGGEPADPGLDTIERWFDRLTELGEERKFNIQLSGGEPAVREDLPEIVAMGKRKGFEYIQLNTNGRRIALEDGCAEKLKAAGLSAVFLQFDGMRDDIYEYLRGAPMLDVKHKAVERCGRAGLPVTLVPTLLKGVNLDNIGDMIRYMLDNPDVVKGIHFQPASFFGRYPRKNGAPRARNSGDGAASDDCEGRVTMFDVMREIEAQTDGLFAREDLFPITAGHPLCCFSGSFLREKDGSVTSLMRAERRETGGACCCGTDPLEIIRKDRDFVLNKWETDGGERGGALSARDGTEDDGTMGFDEFISYARRNSFTLTGMAFQDNNNLDAERLRRCRVQVFSRYERLIPFCAYNSIYRPQHT